MNFKAVKIAHDQKRWVFEVFTVEEELSVRLEQVAVFAFVLPGETAALPDVGVALAAGRLRDPALEGVGVAVRVRLGGGGLVEQAAEVDEVLSRGCGLFLFDAVPFVGEVVGGDAGTYGSADAPAR